jgi:phytoene desaturase
LPDDYRAELDAMFVHDKIPADPCLYVCAATRSDPTLAPEGCEALFILVSAPSLQRATIDWNIEGPRYRDRIVQSLEKRWGLTDLSRRIVVEKSMSPADLKVRYNANAGSIYGIASNSLRTAFMRPPNRDAKIKRLYFAGGATHPGGGLPLVALSGKIAASMAAEDLK